MKSLPKNNQETIDTNSTDDITRQDIINLAILRNITFKDKIYAKQNITIQKKHIKTAYEIEILDIDGTKHQLMFEVKKYSK